MNDDTPKPSVDKYGVHRCDILCPCLGVSYITGDSSGEESFPDETYCKALENIPVYDPIYAVGGDPLPVCEVWAREMARKENA